MAAKQVATKGKSATPAGSKAPVNKSVEKAAAPRAVTPKAPVTGAQTSAATASKTQTIKSKATPMPSTVKSAPKPTAVKATPSKAKPVIVAKAAKPAGKPKVMAVVAAAHAMEAASPAAAPPSPRPVVVPRALPTGTSAAAATRPAQTPASAATLPRDAIAKQLEAKQAEARAAEAKKKAGGSSQRHGFKVGEYVVYPSHGVGKIVAIEEQVVAGHALELFVITFEQEKMTLRVPTAKLAAVGMRKLAEDGVVRRAMDTLRGRARIKRTMWSRRAQEYENKINSGDLVSISEVVRDLYRAETQPEQSYSERQLFEAALDRMSREIAAVEKLDERGAVQKITEVLSKSAKGRATKATEDAAAAAAAGDAEERAA